MERSDDGTYRWNNRIARDNKQAEIENQPIVKARLDQYSRDVEAWLNRHPDYLATGRERERNEISEDLRWIESELPRALTARLEALSSLDGVTRLVKAAGRDEAWTISTAEIELDYRATSGRGFNVRVREAVETGLAPVRKTLAEVREVVRQKVDYFGTYLGRFDAMLQLTRAEVARQGGESNPNRGQIYLGLFAQDIEFESVATLLTPEEFQFWVGAREQVARLKRQRQINEQVFYLSVIPVPGLQAVGLLLRAFSEDLGGQAHSQGVSDKIWTDATIFVAKEIVSTVPIVGPAIGITTAVVLTIVTLVAQVVIATVQQLLNVYVLGRDFDALGYSVGVAQAVVSTAAPLVGGGAGQLISSAGGIVVTAAPVVVAAAEGEDVEGALLNAGAGLAGSVAGAATGSAAVGRVAGAAANVGAVAVKIGTKGR